MLVTVVDMNSVACRMQVLYPLNTLRHPESLGKENKAIVPAQSSYDRLNSGLSQVFVLI